MRPIVVRVFLITVVPLAIGMRIRARAPRWTAAHEQQAKRAALGMFLLVVVGAVVEGWGEATEHLGELAAAAITLNVLAMGVSFTIARLARLDDPARRRSRWSSGSTTRRWRSPSARPSTRSSRSPPPSTAPSCS